MLLCKRKKSSSDGSSKEKPLVKFAFRHKFLVSFVTLVLCCVWIHLFPLVNISSGEMKPRGTFIAENAILTSRWQQQIGDPDLKLSNSLLDEYVRLENSDLSSKLNWYKERMESFGMTAEVQEYAICLYEGRISWEICILGDNRKVKKQRNSGLVYGIVYGRTGSISDDSMLFHSSIVPVRKNKLSSGRSSLLFSLPQSSSMLLLAAARKISNSSWLSKNMVIVFTASEVDLHADLSYFWRSYSFDRYREKERFVRLSKLSSSIGHSPFSSISSLIDTLSLPMSLLLDSSRNLILSESNSAVSFEKNEEYFSAVSNMKNATTVIGVMPSKYHAGPFRSAVSLDAMLETTGDSMMTTMSPLLARGASSEMDIYVLFQQLWGNDAHAAYVSPSDTFSIPLSMLIPSPADVSRSQATDSSFVNEVDLSSLHPLSHLVCVSSTMGGDVPLLLRIGIHAFTGILQLINTFTLGDSHYAAAKSAQTLQHYKERLLSLYQNFFVHSARALNPLAFLGSFLSVPSVHIRTFPGRFSYQQQFVSEITTECGSRPSYLFEPEFLEKLKDFVGNVELSPLAKSRPGGSTGDTAMKMLKIIERSARAVNSMDERAHASHRQYYLLHNSLFVGLNEYVLAAAVAMLPILILGLAPVEESKGENAQIIRLNSIRCWLFAAIAVFVSLFCGLFLLGNIFSLSHSGIGEKLLYSVEFIIKRYQRHVASGIKDPMKKELLQLIESSSPFSRFTNEDLLFLQNILLMGLSTLIIGLLLKLCRKAMRHASVGATRTLSIVALVYTGMVFFPLIYLHAPIAFFHIFSSMPIIISQLFLRHKREKSSLRSPFLSSLYSTNSFVISLLSNPITIVVAIALLGGATPLRDAVKLGMTLREAAITGYSPLLQVFCLVTLPIHVLSIAF